MIVNSRSEATPATSRFLFTSTTVTWLPGISGAGVSIMPSLPAVAQCRDVRARSACAQFGPAALGSHPAGAAGSPHNSQSRLPTRMLISHWRRLAEASLPPGWYTEGAMGETLKADAKEDRAVSLTRFPKQSGTGRRFREECVASGRCYWKGIEAASRHYWESLAASDRRYWKAIAESDRCYRESLAESDRRYRRRCKASDRRFRED